MQKLIMPFQSQMMLCGYKNAQYRKHWGYEHYGVDISHHTGGAGEDHTIYASGSGTHVAAGEISWDTAFAFCTGMPGRRTVPGI